MIQGIDYAAISPALIVALAAVAVLVADAFDIPRNTVSWISAGSLGAALIAVFALAAGGRRATFCMPSGLRAGGPPSCSYVADHFTLLFQAVVLGAAVVVLLLSLGLLPSGTTRDSSGAQGSSRTTRGSSRGRSSGAGSSGADYSGDRTPEKAVPAGEYHFLLLAAITGALTLVAARDLITLVVALETLSLPVFALVALRRYDGVATEAAVKLLLISVISTAVMLFGISLMYGVTGAMHLDRMAAALAHTPADLRPVASAGVVLVLAGFAFKVAAVPFHFWAPDVYQGAPLPVAAFLSVVSKAAGFAGLAITVTLGFPSYAHVWGPLLGVLAAVTMTLGNLVALRQRHPVRLLAWSSVAQSGYMLAPLAVGSKRLPEAVAATAGYVSLYAVMNLGAFAVVTAVARRAVPAAVPDAVPESVPAAVPGAVAAAVPGALPTPAADLDDYRGLVRRSPLLAAALAFFLICLAGLPPGIMGLFAKIVVFRATVAGGAAWLAVIMALNTVIGLYYYLSWVVRLFAAPPTETYKIRTSTAVGLAIGVAAAGAVVLSVAPQVVLQTVSAVT
jgi:NADH-quinone oxidoreductase subunit N